MVIINFIKDCIDYLNQHSNLVIAVATFLTFFATLAIVYLTCKQTKIAEQKRKDDLFKIRWEFYQDIIKFIRNLNFHLDKQLCSYYHKVTETKGRGEEELIKYQCQIKLKLLLTIYDILESDKEVLIRYKNLYSNYLNPKMFSLKRESLCLFDKDISKSLEHFFNPENIIKAFQEHYKVLMKNRNIEIKDLEHYIQWYGWTTNHHERGLKNKIENVKFTPDPSEMNIHDFIADVIMMSHPKLSVPKFTFNESYILSKELEEKFDKYLKLK